MLDSEPVEIPPSDKIRRFRFRDRNRYLHLMKLGFSKGPGREITSEGLIGAAELYVRHYHLWKILSTLRLFPESIPNIFLYLRNNNAVGLQCTIRKGEKNGSIEILHEVVDLTFQRQGISSRLFRYLLRTLDSRKPHTVLTKVREENIPQLKNREKSGFKVFSRSLTYCFDLAAHKRIKRFDRLKPVHQENSVALIKPRWRDAKKIKISSTPREIVDIDPTLIFPLGLDRRLSGSLKRLFISPLVWRRGIVEKNILQACGFVFFHRLQKTYLLDLSAIPGSGEETAILLNAALNFLQNRPLFPILIELQEHQREIIQSVVDAGFTLRDKHLLLFRIIPFRCVKQIHHHIFSPAECRSNLENPRDDETTRQQNFSSRNSLDIEEA